MGSVVFELIRFEKCPIFNIERVQIFSKYRRILMQGFFYVQESNEDLTLDHYLSYPPIEPSLKEFLYFTRKFQGTRTGSRTRVDELRGKDATNWAIQPP